MSLNGNGNTPEWRVVIAQVDSVRESDDLDQQTKKPTGRKNCFISIAGGALSFFCPDTQSGDFPLNGSIVAIECAISKGKMGKIARWGWPTLKAGNLFTLSDAHDNLSIKWVKDFNPERVGGIAPPGVKA